MSTQEKIEKVEGYVPTNLLCEYVSNPLGIDVTSPRLSWILNHSGRGQLQSAYHVLVASSRSKLEANCSDKWDSGKVESNHSVNVAYQGSPLDSGKTYYWKVRVWNKKGKVSPYSDVARFEMGLLQPSCWQGEWIGWQGGKTGEALLVRKEFAIDKPVSRARVYISGLGYYELHLNGKKVGDHVLDPGWTEYTKTVLYVTYDVIEYLREGANAIGVILGNGWYGSPQMIFQMNVELADGTARYIISEGWGWSVASSPITRNSIYDGEIYDARLEKPGWDSPSYEESPYEWMNAERLEGPGGVMKAQMLEPIKVLETINPVAIGNPKPGVYVYDMGQNIAGWVRLMVQGPQDTAVTLKFAEILYEDGTINRENLRTAEATDTYILKGEDKEVYEPRFTYHGFRYVQMSGFPGTPKLKNLQGRVVHSAVEPIGKFTCSNELLNKIHQNVVRTESNNLHSVPTDCPQRDERLGWLNDMTVRAEEAICNFNMARLYTKWLRDIRDAQNKKTGSIPETAPYRWGSDPGDPVDCYPFLVWYLYQYYGDRRILEENYNGIKQWVDFLDTKTDDYIVSYCRVGDWSPPIKESFSADDVGVPTDSPGAITMAGAFPANTPGLLTSTAYYYYAALILSQVAHILEKSGHANKYSELASHIKAAFNTRFLNRHANQYATGSQCSNALPLFLGLVPETDKIAVLENLVEDIIVNHKGHLSTGNQGTKYVLQVLTDHGQTDVAYAIVTQTTYPSWGYMISKGATTIWERWEYMTGPGMNSHDHPMLGSVDAWFYKALAGINPDPDGPGYQRIVIRPHLAGDLKYVNASVKTIRGVVSSSWRKFGNSLTLNVVLPVNSEARVGVPKSGLSNITIKESQKTIWTNDSFVEGNEGIMSGSEDDRYVTFEIGSGSYFFEISGTPLSEAKRLKTC